MKWQAARTRPPIWHPLLLEPTRNDETLRKFSNYAEDLWARELFER
jgi:hypothetical protein